MKTALATCLVLCLFAADLNGQDVTIHRKDSLEGITVFNVKAQTSVYRRTDGFEEDTYIKDLVELNLRKYGIRVGDEDPKTEQGSAYLMIFASKDPRDNWEIELSVTQLVLLPNKTLAAKKFMYHLCSTYELKAFTDSKQEGVDEVLTTFLNNYLAVNQKYRDTPMVQPSPTPASNELYPFPSNRRTIEPSKVIQVGGIGG